MMDVFVIAVAPVALLVGAFVGSRRMRLDPRTGLGLRLPSVSDAIVYSAAFLVLLVLAELALRAAGESPTPGDWRNRYAPGALALRVVFAALIYPIAEEVFFRGFLLGAITRRAGALTAIVATAAFFTLLHGWQGPWLGAVQIFVDGLFFAYVRLRSGSLLLPILFHVAGNTFAVLQRL